MIASSAATQSGIERARAVRDRLLAWTLGEALPTWCAFGIDEARGGFHERLGQRVEILQDRRRVRVQARQVFSFAVAGRLGWTGPWRRAVDEGLAYVLARCVLPDGTVRMTIEPDGRPFDDSFSLYDQAFALFAFAAAASVASDRSVAETAALRLRQTLMTRYKHPVAGFEEGDPRTLPLKANPHMHLFEACLAWVEVGGDETWGRLADEIAELCLRSFLNPEAGWLYEYFDGDWARASGEEGRVVEPGHQYEWAWLLVRWGLLRGRADAIAAAGTLADLAETHGLNRREGVAINVMLDDLTVKDGGSRLWPQTERIKGHVALAGVAGDWEARDRHMGLAADAAEALERYLRVAAPGLWWDKMMPDGRFVDEPAPASSFYHVVCAVEELDKAVKALG
ncbi:AGE family epimerase/isomerase [Chthonobacter rhizosphaerae]|uniref:AGE family epimerase/isomerase n=1 Tax=Chthonobacter rhizosphaerae TaxID=2735553 RepID=UPI0015EEA343|nr:AGE family epimerase/isomerase [Chthonobacter rhizosphaerae]